MLIKKSIPRNLLITLFFTTALFGCGTPSTTPLIDTKAKEIEKISVSSAQKLKVGDGSTEVVKVLGTPNIITKGKSGNESWVYDRVSEHFELIQSSGKDGFIFSRYTEQTRRASTTKTFIVVIDFDEKNIVTNIAYRFTQY
jgi:outer membrane protein assembly factor BamE (lipoprotein component of BamABCDE complex)